MNIYDTWKPRTYYILENKTSGKKYIGQTIQDINKYLGSGSYWINHCKQHGGYNRKNIAIVSSKMYETKESAQKFLDNFTKENADYWEDHNMTWANLCEENTNDCVFTGGDIARASNQKRVKDGTHHLLGGDHARQRVEDGTHNFIGGKIQGIASRKRVKDGTHHLLGGDYARQRVEDGTHNFINPPTHICPHCNKEGKGGPMHRWHFDNCKFK
jgi:hypothetical protein